MTLPAGQNLFVQRFVDRRHYYSAASVTAHFVADLGGEGLENFERLCPNVGVNDDRLGSSVVMLGDGSDGFVAGDCGGVGGS